MSRQYIPVVWGADRKYILQAFVVMRSILLHSREKYHFFILTADEIDEEVKGFAGILGKEFGNFKISVRYVDSARLEGVQICNSHLSKAAYLRLFIPEVIQEYDKCIYLDCDLMVQGDLKELYETELGDNYLAGVKDCHIIADTPREREHQRIIGIPTRERYINSGVLVMGLKKMRQDGMETCFAEQMKRENWYEDQDVLNVCCYPLIKVLPLKYNLFHFYLGAHIKFLYDLPYDRQDFDFDQNVPYILHMGGACKAWDNCRIKGAREWWQTAEAFHETQSYHFYRQRCKEQDDRYGLSDLISRAVKSRHIMIWGYSENGRRLCDILREYKLNNIDAFVDNNKAVWGESYQGIPVTGIESVDCGQEDMLWIISCQLSYEAVIMQLKSYNFSEKNIVRHKEVFTDYFYLLSMHECAYDDMISEIVDREYVCKLPDRVRREQYIRDIINNPSRYEGEHAYLAGKYGFQYWIEA